VLALCLVGRTNVDLQYWLRRDDRGNPWYRADRFLQTQQALLNRVALVSRFENCEDDCLRCGTALGRAGDSEELPDTRLGDDFFVHLLLIGTHLLRRRPLLRDENAAGRATVSHWKQRERQMGEEKPKTKDADEQDRHGQISAIQKLIQCDAVGIDDSLDEITGPLLHSRAPVAGAAFVENSRTHQRRQR